MSTVVQRLSNLLPVERTSDLCDDSLLIDGVRLGEPFHATVTTMSRRSERYFTVRDFDGLPPCGGMEHPLEPQNLIVVDALMADSHEVDQQSLFIKASLGFEHESTWMDRRIVMMMVMIVLVTCWRVRAQGISGQVEYIGR